MIKIQAQISLEEWKKYLKGEEAIAHNRTLENEQYLQIIVDEHEVIELTSSDTISFTIKKEQ